jgi:hypothetical protein
VCSAASSAGHHLSCPMHENTYRLVLSVAAGGKSFFVTLAALLGTCHGSVFVVIAPLKAQVTEQVPKANALFKRAGSTARAVDLSGDTRQEHNRILNRLKLRDGIRLVYSASLMAPD